MIERSTECRQTRAIPKQVVIEAMSMLASTKRMVPRTALASTTKDRTTAVKTIIAASMTTITRQKALNPVPDVPLLLQRVLFSSIAGETEVVREYTLMLNLAGIYNIKYLRAIGDGGSRLGSMARVAETPR